jgi:hypothetical protein
MADFFVPSDRPTKLASDQFDYFHVAGATVYYGEQSGFTSSSNLGSLTAGQTLTRRAPTWCISAAGGATLQQRIPATSQGSVATTAATNTSPYGYSTAAQADGLVAAVNNILAFLKGTAGRPQ